MFTNSVFVEELWRIIWNKNIFKLKLITILITHTIIARHGADKIHGASFAARQRFYQRLFIGRD